MKITWYGQACFQLQSDDGTVVLCDPYHPDVGYAPHPQSLDVVTISHEHGDHNWLGWLEGEYAIFRGPGEHAAAGVAATGYASWHDGNSGAQRGANTVFVIKMDGIKVCHLGDLGHEPDEELYAKLAGVDVLLIPVGGYYTIDAKQAAAIEGKLQPRLTIPMHFDTGVRAGVPIAVVDEFAALTGAVRAGSSSLEFSNEYSGPGTVILDFER